MNEHDDDHDRGLGHDLAVMRHVRMLDRRRAIGLFAAGGSAVLLAGCGGGSEGSTTSSSGSTSSGSTSSGSSGTATCTAAASETAGPYPGDGSNSANGSLVNVLASTGVVRNDIRSSFGSATTVAAGVPLSLTLALVNSNSSCTVLANYAVYLWHCDRDGHYSLYDITGVNYLRGVALTDTTGQVTFTTIFPGCYSGRYPHMHFEIYASLATATGYQNRLFTSQLAMPSAACSTVYSGADGYATSQRNFANTSIASDNVFGDNSSAQMAVMTPTLSGSVAAGYTGSVTIGIPM